MPLDIDEQRRVISFALNILLTAFKATEYPAIVGTMEGMQHNNRLGKIICTFTFESYSVTDKEN